MKSQNPTPGKRSPKRLTFVIFGLALLTAACSYGYSVYSEAKRYEALLPRLRLDSLVRDVRKYESLSGRFPESFDELEKLVWKHQGRKPTFDRDGTAYTLGNYLYMLGAAGERRVTIWAIPLGERRDEASTHFVVVTPERVMRWKGAAIKLEDMGRVSPDPSVGSLAGLGLTRQPDEGPSVRRPGRKATLSYLPAGRRHSAVGGTHGSPADVVPRSVSKRTESPLLRGEVLPIAG